MVGVITALQASPSAGTNVSPVRLEPGTELRAKVEASLPNNVLRLSIGSATLDVRANAPLPQGTELTLKVTGDPGRPEIQLLPDAKTVPPQTSQGNSGLAAEVSSRASAVNVGSQSPAAAADPATMQNVVPAAAKSSMLASAQTSAFQSSAMGLASVVSAATSATPVGQTSANPLPVSGQGTSAVEPQASLASLAQTSSAQISPAQAASQPVQAVTAQSPLPQNSSMTPPTAFTSGAQVPDSAPLSAVPPVSGDTGGSIAAAPAVRPSPTAVQVSGQVQGPPPLPQETSATPAMPTSSSAVPPVNMRSAPAGDLPGNLQLQTIVASPPLPAGAGSVATASPPPARGHATAGPAPQAGVQVPPVDAAAVSEPALSPMQTPKTGVVPASPAMGATVPDAPKQAGSPPLSSAAPGGSPSGPQTAPTPAAPTATPEPTAQRGPNVAVFVNETPVAGQAVAAQTPATGIENPQPAPAVQVPAPAAPAAPSTPTMPFNDVAAVEAVSREARVPLPANAYADASGAQATVQDGEQQKLPVAPELKQAAETALPKLTEQQASLANLFAQVSVLTSSQSAAGNSLSEPVKQVMQQILGLRLQPQVDDFAAKSVQAAVKNSGLFREAALMGNGQNRKDASHGPSLGGDLKSLLLNLKGLLHDLGARTERPKPMTQPAVPSLKLSPQGDRPANVSPVFGDGDDKPVLNRLLHDIDASLARVRLSQMVSRGLGGDEPSVHSRSMDITLDLPILVNGQTAIVQMQIGRDPEGTQAEQGDGGGWRLRFGLDLTETGPMEAAISLRGGGTYVSLWVDRGDTLERLRADRETLEATFTHAGLDLRELRFLRGLPRRTEARFGAVVDRQS